jgi:hypothetical protein
MTAMIARYASHVAPGGPVALWLAAMALMAFTLRHCDLERHERDEHEAGFIGAAETMSMGDAT